MQLTNDLFADVPAQEVLTYLPAGMLKVTQVWPPPDQQAEQPSLAL